MLTETSPKTPAADQLDTAVVGDTATYCGYSDRKAGRIIARTASRITWQADKAVLLNGANSGQPDSLQFCPGGFFGHTSGKQRWELAADENGMTIVFSRRVLRNGSVRWVEVGAPANTMGCSLIAGQHHHYDFNF